MVHLLVSELRRFQNATMKIRFLIYVTMLR